MTSRTTGRELSPASLAIAFAAGFLAVLTFYEAMFLVLYVGGVILVPPFSMKPMPPFGVPEVFSQSFWGVYGGSPSSSSCRASSPGQAIGWLRPSSAA